MKQILKVCCIYGLPGDLMEMLFQKVRMELKPAFVTSLQAMLMLLQPLWLAKEMHLNVHTQILVETRDENT